MRMPAVTEDPFTCLKVGFVHRGGTWLEQVMRTPAAMSAYACSSATSLPYSRRRCCCSSCGLGGSGASDYKKKDISGQPTTKLSQMPKLICRTRVCSLGIPKTQLWFDTSLSVYVSDGTR
jgi:hypothetical protein